MHYTPVISSTMMAAASLLMILSLMVGLQMDFVKSRSTDIAKPNRKKTAPSLELTETP